MLHRLLLVLCLLAAVGCSPTHARSSSSGSGSSGGSSGSTGTTSTSSGTTGSTTSGTTGSISCTNPSQCPGFDSFCQARTCNGFCGLSFTSLGTPLPDQYQTAGDCQREVCDGKGRIISVSAPTDVPDSGNPCISDQCSSDGTPLQLDVDAGLACPKGTCDGQGTCVNNTGCTSPTDCPGTDTECQTRTCLNNTCGFSYTAKNTPLGKQTAGDCSKQVCDGQGGVVSVADDTDVPVDGNACTQDLCTNGVPSNPPDTAGTACTSADGGKLCNGSGTCVACLAPSDCAGTDTECATRTCTSGACGWSYAKAGTPLKTQTPGDCKLNECDGSGNVTTAVDTTDVPNDNNPCTTDLCNGGTPTHANVDAGVACGTGLTCDGQGNCIGGCTKPSDCPGTDSACASRTCNNNVCGMSYVASGTVVGNPTAGDCHTNQCDGKGNIINAIDNTDVPVDNNACTQDVCTNGVPSNPPASSGTACTANSGKVCDGQGNCVQCVVNTDCPDTSIIGLCNSVHHCAAPLLISEVQSRGASGGSDEFVELYNPTSSPVTLDSSWKIQVEGVTNTTNHCPGYGVRWQGTGVVVPAHGHVLVVGSAYSQLISGDGVLSSGVNDASSTMLTFDSVSGTYWVDALCMAYDSTTLGYLTGSNACNAINCAGTPATSPHDNTSGTNTNVSLERKPGGSQGNGTNTWDNASDFQVSNPSNPQNVSSTPVP